MAELTAAQQKRRHALREARGILERTAGDGATITYGQLVDQMTTKYALNGAGLTDLLCTISKETHKANRGLLSAVVVERSSGQPAHGFFEFAATLGFVVSDEESFWEARIAEVHERCASGPA